MTIAFPAPREALVEVEGLTLGFGRADPVLHDVSLSIAPGECLALVGESGSGKSVTARSLVGLAGYGARTRARRLSFEGADLLGHRERDWQTLRGRRIGFVLQDALGSLDPLRTVGAEIEEPLRIAGGRTRAERQAKVIELLRAASVPEPEVRALQYPRELSGGLRQRALIASAIANEPALLIADEPTTALDAAVQGQILELLRSLRSRSTALLVVSHDLAVVASLADRIAVMRAGRIVEQGPAQAILREPRHDYTRALVAAAASIHGAAPRRSSTLPSLTGSAPVMEAEAVSKSFRGPAGVPRPAVSEVSLSLAPRETIGIVGASGSGKTTLIRMLLGLETPDSGTVRWQGEDWQALDPAQRRARRRRVQVVFQDPFASFDPRYTVTRILNEPLALTGLRGRSARRERAAELLGLVRLDPAILDRRPIEISGGQRQRVAIARALASQPEILICDEPVSALDVSVQAEVLALLDDLKARLGLACIFISHDLGVVRRVSDRIAVMHDGRIVEQGTADQVFTAPSHPYTASLLSATPSFDPHARRAYA